MKVYQEKLNFLLNKYQVEKKVILINYACAEVDGKEIVDFRRSFLGRHGHLGAGAAICNSWLEAVRRKYYN